MSEYEPKRALAEIRRYWSDNDAVEEAAFDRAIAAHDADVRRATLAEARGAILDSAPPLNSELRHDGTEDKIGSAYIEGFHDALSAVDELIRAAALGDAPTGGQ